MLKRAQQQEKATSLSYEQNTGLALVCNVIDLKKTSLSILN